MLFRKCFFLTGGGLSYGGFVRGGGGVVRAVLFEGFLSVFFCLGGGGLCGEGGGGGSVLHSFYKNDYRYTCFFLSCAHYTIDDVLHNYYMIILDDKVS